MATQLGRRGFASLLGVLVVASALAGCGPKAADSQGAGSSDRPALDARIIAQADPRAVPQPLATYVFDATQKDVINRAMLLTANRCMSQFGIAPLTVWPSLSIDTLWERYGVWDPASATTGYLSPEDLQYKGAQSLLPYSGDARAVYDGTVPQYGGVTVAKGGCAAQTNNAVWNVAGVSNLAQFVGQLDQEARERSMQDPRVVPLLDAWKSCMKDKGWDYENPLAPLTYWDEYPRRGTSKNLTAASVSAEEKKSAQDDVACKHSTLLLGTWLAADIAYQKQVIERESQRLSEWQKGMAAFIANDNSIIAKG